MCGLSWLNSFSLNILFSQYVYTVACINTPSFYPNNILIPAQAIFYLSINVLICWLALGCFCFWGVYIQYDCEHLSTHFIWRYFNFSWVYDRERIANSYGNLVFNISRFCQSVKLTVHNHVRTCNRILIFLCLYQYLSLLAFLIKGILKGGYW